MIRNLLQNARRLPIAIRAVSRRLAQSKHGNAGNSAVCIALAFAWPFSLKSVDATAENEVASADDDPQGRKLKERDEKRAPLIQALQFAKLKTMQQQFPLALRYYHDALRELHALHELHDDDMLTESEFQRARVKVFLEMGNAQLVAGKLQDAELLFVDSLRGLPAVGEDVESNAFLEVSLKLAEIYAQTNRFEQAEHGMQYCLSVLSEKCESPAVAKHAETGVKKTNSEAETDETKGNSDRDAHVTAYFCDLNTLALYGMTLDAFARFLYVRADYANEPYHLAEQPSENTWAKSQVVQDSNDSLSTQDSTLARNQRDLQLITSLNFFEKAVQVADAVYGPQSPQNVRLRSELACVHTALRNTTLARSILETALQECEKSSDEATRENLAVLQLNLGEIYLQEFVNLRLKKRADDDAPSVRDTLSSEADRKVSLSELLKKAGVLCRTVHNGSDAYLKARANACLKRVNELHRSST